MLSDPLPPSSHLVEVDDPDTAVEEAHEVGQLEVAVHHAPGMHVVEALGHTLHKEAQQVLWERLPSRRGEMVR